MTEVTQAIVALKSWTRTILKFVYVDDENNEIYTIEILTYEEIFEDRVKNDDEFLDSQDLDLDLINNVVFKEFESLYKQIVRLKIQKKSR